MTVHFLILIFAEAYFDNWMRAKKKQSPHGWPIVAMTTMVWLVSCVAWTDGTNLHDLLVIGAYAFVFRGALFNFIYNGFDRRRGWGYASGKWYDLKWSEILGVKPEWILIAKFLILSMSTFIIELI